MGRVLWSRLAGSRGRWRAGAWERHCPRSFCDHRSSATTREVKFSRKWITFLCWPGSKGREGVNLRSWQNWRQ